MFGHWLAEHGRRQKTHTDPAKQAPTQIGDEYEFPRQLTASSKHMHRIVPAKVMKRERTENEIITFVGLPMKQIRLDKIDFWITRTEFSRDLESCRLSIQRVDAQLGANLAPVLSDQSGNIAGTRRKIDNPQARSGFDPTAKKHRDQCITAEPAIELADVFEIVLQLG